MLNAKRLYQGSPTTNTAGVVIYTCPDDHKTIIKNIIQANKTTGEASIHFFLVPNGETKSSTHEIISAAPIDALDTRFIESSIVMNAGDELYSYQSNTSAINMHISGIEYSDV